MGCELRWPAKSRDLPLAPLHRLHAAGRPALLLTATLVPSQTRRCPLPPAVRPAAAWSKLQTSNMAICFLHLCNIPAPPASPSPPCRRAKKLVHVPLPRAGTGAQRPPTFFFLLVALPKTTIPTMFSRWPDSAMFLPRSALRSSPLLLQ